MKPTIGRIVHYVTGNNEPGNHYPAIVTHVWSDTCVNLNVFPKGQSMDGENSGVKTSVVLDSNGERAYSWHWPERE